MKKFSIEQKKLISEFLANIGVAWFAAGVIGIFVSGVGSPIQILGSLSWGIVLSLIFLWWGSTLLKGVKS